MTNNFKLFTKTSEASVYTEITPYAGNLEWKDSTMGLASEISFDYANEKMNVNVGDRFRLMNNSDEILSGIIVDESYGKNKICSYTGFDYAFYLNKNEVIIQFNGISATQAIKQLLNQFDKPIPVGFIADMPTMIKKIYKDVVVSDIIKDILDQVYKKTGIKHRLETRYGKIYIERYKDLYLNVNTSIPGSDIEFNITEAVSGFSATNSIQEMKNRILVVDNGANTTRILAKAENNTNIDKYGLLQSVEIADETIVSKNQKVADTLLKELNKITKTRSVELLGNPAVRSGRILNFNYPEFDFVGSYLITYCNHKVSGGIYKMSLELESFDD